MIKEDYVNFETAKLLKEKGFDEPCYLGYNKNGEYFPTNNRSNSQIIQPDFCYICCPTLQMSMKWLREVHNIHIIIHPYTEMEGHNWSFIFDKFAYGCWQELGIYITDSWNTYEEAAETAIRYCLKNLI